MKYRVTVLFDNYCLLLPVGSFIVLTQSTITDLPYARQSTRGYQQTIKPSIRVLRYETASFSFPLFLSHLTKLSVLLHTHIRQISYERVTAYGESGSRRWEVTVVSLKARLPGQSVSLSKFETEC
jgi:hypothetical protein